MCQRGLKSNFRHSTHVVCQKNDLWTHQVNSKTGMHRMCWGNICVSDEEETFTCVPRTHFVSPWARQWMCCHVCPNDAFVFRVDAGGESPGHTWMHLSSLVRNLNHYRISLNTQIHKGPIVFDNHPPHKPLARLVHFS